MFMKKTFVFVLICSILATFLVPIGTLSYVEASPLVFSPYGDFDNNGVVNIIDIMIISYCFNTRIGDPGYYAECDLNSDGVINMADVMIVARYYNKVVPTVTPTPTYIPTSTPTSTHAVTPTPMPT